MQLILRDGFIYSISFSDAKRVDNNINKSNLNKNVKIDVDKKGDESEEGEIFPPSFCNSETTHCNFQCKLNDHCFSLNGE